jgi:ABC-type uncharacterized transport system substrate-binding protein
MRRRDFISFVGGAAACPLTVRAQQPASQVIGILWPGASSPPSPRMESFREGLRQFGFIEGQNIAIEIRYAQNGLKQLPELAAELVRMKVGVIASFGDFTPRVVQKATGAIPIVAIGDDILGAGLVASLSRPGGNTTGLTILSPELSAKRLEVLREIIPGISRVAALWDPTTGKSQVSITERAARSMHLMLQVVEVRKRADLIVAFRAALKEQAQALNVFSSPFLASLYRGIIDLSAEHRLPAIFQWKEHAQAGGLVSYGPSLAAMWRQTGTIVAKILKGAKPGDLPVEQPTTFELVINLKTAKTLGLAVPPSLLTRADEVIE